MPVVREAEPASSVFLKRDLSTGGNACSSVLVPIWNVCSIWMILYDLSRHFRGENGATWGQHHEHESVEIHGESNGDSVSVPAQ